MSDEFINITTEDTFDVENEEIVEVGVIAEDLEQNVEVSEFAEVVEVEPIEEIEIEVTESIGWVGGDSTRHYSLYGRDELDQHPITAITGLREELNDIEALDVVYSNEKNHADYYLWEDENALQENRIGYFVSACSDINKIKKCAADDDILGVTVDSAGFVGAQDDIARDIKYGLVVTTGVIHVRCEQSVGAGDYVVSNDYGYAQSNKNGYKVVGRHQIDGVEYAEIVLATPINRICKLSDDVENVNTRMANAEKNIISAINVANEAYNKAVECNNVSEDAVKNALEALNKSNDIKNDFNSMQGSLSMINGLAVEARMIAESAGVSAEAIRREAVATANQALSDVSGAINTLDNFFDETMNEINNVDSKAQLAVENLAQLKDDMEPLAEWTDNEGAYSFAGFVAEADRNTARIAELVQWQGKVEDGSVESIAGLDKRVSDNEATLEAVASYKKENEDGTTTDGFAGLRAQVDENEAGLSTLAKYEYIDSEGKVSRGLSGLVQQVVANASSIEMLAGFEDEDVDSLGEIAIKVGEHESAITTLTSFKDEASSTIAYTKQVAESNKSSIEGLTSVDAELQTNMAQVQQQADDNGASIQSMVASIDKYSVGEYSQSYGLTYAQAQSILQSGMVYVPTKHGDIQSHSEKFEDTGKTYTFNPGYFYIWSGETWVESNTRLVAFSSEELAPSDVLTYWYVDSNDAPDGYEAYALYKYDRDNQKWNKVNILDGNINNRIISMIRQTTNKIAEDVVDAQGNIALHQLWLETNSANIEDVVSWKSDLDSKDASNIAAIKQTADAAGSSIAQIAASIGNYTTIEGTWDEVGKDTNLTYYTTEDKMYWYYKDGRWNSTDNAADAGLVINAASIITAINNDTSEISLNADKINLLSEEIALGGYLTQPGSKIRALVGQNVYNYPGFFIYSFDDYYKKSDGTYKPYMEFWPSGSNDDGERHSMITGANELHLRVDQMDDTTFTSLKCTSSGGKLYGSWDFGQDQFFTHRIGSDMAFILESYNDKDEKVRHGSFYYYNDTKEVCLKSDQGTNLLLNVKNNTRIKCTNSGGSLYGDWYIDNYKPGSEIVSSDGTHLGRFEYYSGAPYDCQAVYFAKPISFFSGTHKGGSSWGFSYYTNGNNQYGVFAVCSGGGYLNGTWKLNNSTLTASDRNKKNSIENLDERYNTFFDNLCPIRYKYNDGTSSRYHTGFIAQDVEQAIANSNLDTLDFAGYVKDEDGVSYLRYEEFVSLNTQQIQKAKTRIAELENKVEKLEALIKGE